MKPGRNLRENSSANYIHFDSVRRLNVNSLRNSGGVSLFIKYDIFKTKVISRRFPELSEAVVLLCKLSQIGDMKVVITYFTYVSPEGTCIYDGLDEKNGINKIRNNIDNIMMNCLEDITVKI